MVVFSLYWSFGDFFLSLSFFQVQGQVFSEANCANLISTLITNLINQYQNLQSDFTNRIEMSKASAALNGVRTVEGTVMYFRPFLNQL